MTEAPELPEQAGRDPLTVEYLAQQIRMVEKQIHELRARFLAEGDPEQAERAARQLAALDDLALLKRLHRAATAAGGMLTQEQVRRIAGTPPNELPPNTSEPHEEHW